MRRHARRRAAAKTSRGGHGAVIVARKAGHHPQRRFAMQSFDTGPDAHPPSEQWPVFGHASPQRFTPALTMPGETLPANGVDQNFEEPFFE
jgi:hypothetical protein